MNRIPIKLFVCIHLCLLISLLLIALPSLDLAAASQQTAPITVWFNGKRLALQADPMVINGNAMLPMKATFDVLHIQASYNNKNKSISVTNGGVTTKGQLGKTMVTVGKRNIQLAQPIMEKNGRIYVPLRFVSLATGKDVTYHGTKRQIMIGFTEEQMRSFQISLLDGAMKGDTALMERMLAYGADPNMKLIPIHGDNTPLDLAVKHNKTDAVRILLQKGASVQLSDPTIPFTAVHRQNADIVEMLLDAGINPNLTSHGQSLLQLASSSIHVVLSDSEYFIQEPSLEVVAVLLAHGADPGIDDSLLQAVQAQHYDIVQALLRAGANPDKADPYQNTPYRLSRFLGISKWLQIQDRQPQIPSIQIRSSKGQLLDHGIIDCRYVSGNTPKWESISVGMGKKAYLDVEAADCLITSVRTSSYTYLSPKGIPVRIKDGNALPGEIQLKDPNIKGTLRTDTNDNPSNGLVEIRDQNGIELYGVAEIQSGSFSIYLPEGSYQLIPIALDQYGGPPQAGYPLTIGKEEAKEVEITVKAAH